MCACMLENIINIRIGITSHVAQQSWICQKKCEGSAADMATFPKIYYQKKCKNLKCG